MTENYEDFDQLFNSNSNNSDSGSGSLTAAEVERISTNVFMRGLQALEQGSATVQKLREDAMRQTEAAHPGFIERIHDPQICRKFIEERPATARAILAAEAGTGTTSLPELYDSFDEKARSYGLPSKSLPAPEGTASTLSLQQINSLPLAERRKALESLKDRVGDMPIDEADTTSEAFRIERGGGE